MQPAPFGPVGAAARMMWLSLLLSAASVDVTVYPYCSNSFRVKIAPPGAVLPPDSAASARLAAVLEEEGLTEVPSALTDDCAGQAGVKLHAGGAAATHGNLAVSLGINGSIAFHRIQPPRLLFQAAIGFSPSTAAEGFVAATFNTSAGSHDERIYGLGQGGWTAEGGCPSGEQLVQPLERNGGSFGLLQRKFHVTIPFAYSSAGYGLLYNMPGYGNVDVGGRGVGGMSWSSDAALALDLWVSTAAEAEARGGTSHRDVYRQYADATGHAPPLRADAALFWQSRNRYKSSAIALGVAERYAALRLPVGVLVVDYHNQRVDGDFAPDPTCYPSVRALASGVRELLNASTVFSFWPEVKVGAAEEPMLREAGCLANADLGGRALDPTRASCRSLVWKKLLAPRYFERGVTAFWLDETDGEGTGGGDGDHGYDTSYGPAAAYSNLWVGDYLSTFSAPVAKAGGEPPLLLTRGVWAGGQRHGVVLWSSDIWSSFEQLRSMVPQGVHASLSGVPWWTTDVGGYGCGFSRPNDSPYMRELIVRWYEFGLFCPVFRTHGCRNGPSEPDAPPCTPRYGSCGGNEVWSYGAEVQAHLSRMVETRARDLAPYILELSANVSASGVPTMRPLWWEFPDDPRCVGVGEQYMLGPSLLVAPVTAQNATNRTLYFPSGARWRSFWDRATVVAGGIERVVEAPLGKPPVYWRM